MKLPRDSAPGQERPCLLELDGHGLGKQRQRTLAALIPSERMQ